MDGKPLLLCNNFGKEKDNVSSHLPSVQAGK